MNSFPQIRSTRRNFLVGCSTAIAAMAGARIGSLSFAQSASPINREILLLVFLRGGMDGLSLIPPIAGDDRAHYEEARRRTKIPVTGAGAALPLNAQFGLHPSAEALRELFQSKKLAIVQAVGTGGSRSHFDAMKFMELGTPGSKSIPTGWLTRHLESSPSLAGSILAPALAIGSSPPTSLQGSDEMLNLADQHSLHLSNIGHWAWARYDHPIALRRIYQQGESFIHEAGITALNASGLMESYVTENYKPRDGVVYPDNGVANQLKVIAQMIKLDVGLRVATLDIGGWDTHENQGNQPGGQFANLIKQLSDGLAAFYADLDTSVADSPSKRLTILVQSEFGRRVRENDNAGTDHGTGNPMLILGGNVNGGIYGEWPGLHPDQRYDSADLAPTTDFRQLLSEILIRRLANPNLGHVFPQYTNYRPLNIVSGQDLAPNYSIPQPTVPGAFAAQKNGNAVRISWAKAQHATNYRLERRTSAAGNWELLATLPADMTQFDDLYAPAGSSPAYRLLSYSPAGESAFTPVASTESGGTALEQWRLQHFGTVAATGDAANDRVLTSDGLSNFTKYALGLDPRVAATETSGFTPGKPRTETAGGMFSLVYVRPQNRDDVNYEVRLSPDLNSWTVLADAPDGSSNGYERRRASVPTSGRNKQFMRLVVTAR